MELNYYYNKVIFKSKILISKMSVKMNLGILTKNHAAEPEIGFLTESIAKLFGRATAMRHAASVGVNVVLFYFKI